MKKLIYLVSFLVVAMATLVSCGDNEDFYKPHVLSPEEIQKLREIDSLDSVARTKIDADLVLNYRVSDYTTPDGMWTSKDLYVDLEAVGQVFGMTADEVCMGIINEKITGAGMDAESHRFDMTSSTSNGIIGHWWTNKGAIGTWANDLANLVCYVEWQGWYDEEKGQAVDNFYRVGQFPGRLEPGFNITVYETMVCGDKKVVFAINYIILDPENATVLNTENLEVNIPVNRTTSVRKIVYTPVGFNLAKVKSDLGLEEISIAENIIGYDQDGKFTQNRTATGGFWYNENGKTAAYSSKENKVAVVYDLEDPNNVQVALMPKNSAVGDKYEVDFGFFADGFVDFLHITVNVTEEE